MAERWRIELAARGRLGEYLRRLPREYAAATTGVIARKAVALKKALRRNVERAGLGTRLANAIRHETNPRSRREPSMTAMGRVFSRAIVRRSGRAIDLITLFDEGTTIRARRGRFLAIPTPEAGSRNTPSRFRRGELIPLIRGRTGVLVHERQPDVPLFVLVRQVTLRDRLSVGPLAEKTLRNTSVLLARDMERRATRLAKRLNR